MIDTEAEFLMEVTDKTKADVKVGVPFNSNPFACDRNGRLIRVELSLTTRVKFACLKLPRCHRSTRKSSSLVRHHSPPPWKLDLLNTSFRIVRKFKIFNTNNLWINLKGSYFSVISHPGDPL